MTHRLFPLLAALLLVPACGDDNNSDKDLRKARDGAVVEEDLAEPTPCGNGELDEGEQCDDGNQDPGDGCEPDCTPTPTTEKIVTCPGDSLPAPAGGAACDIVAGSGKLLVTGTVLGEGKVYRGGQVLVDAAGKIECVGCDCSAGASGATELKCPQTVISPGLINAHDHITYALGTPNGLPAEERYQHRHDWRKGKNGHKALSCPGSASADQVAFGELRFVLSGATSLNGSGSAAGFLRNLDKSNALEGLNQPAVKYETFPLDDSGGTTFCSGCGYSTGRDSSSTATGQDAYCPHVAEGIDCGAHNEFLCTNSGNYDLVQPNSAFIHGVGAMASDVGAMATDRTKLIWSPRSNVSLYGNTAPVTMYARMGVVIALGTDWIYSGSMNMQRELKCADDLNQIYYDGFFSDEDIWKMATVNAARAMAMDDAIGILKAGHYADIAVFRKNGHVDHRAVIDGTPKEVALVLRGGKVLYGDDKIVAALPTGTDCDVLDVCGASKRVCAKREIGKNYSAIKSACPYPLFVCGDPPKEPTCVPKRTRDADVVNGSTKYDGLPKADDMDGDGIKDSADNCPKVFNPIRPMDDKKQADFDGDGQGDVCDPCPVNKGTTNCKPIDPDDPDGDGFKTAQDNCPTVANDQKDGDKDGKGDACDPCPTVANPGAQGCPGNIYDIKNGTIKENETVTLAKVLVTAVGKTGFFVQAKMGDAGYKGVDYSGLFVYTGTVPAPAINPGDRVTISSGLVYNYYNELELKNVTYTVDSTGEKLPDPLVVAPTDIVTGGPRAKALEGVLVKVQNVTVTALEPTPGGGDKAPTNEFVVTGDLRVNDFLYLVSPMPTVGQKYSAISGVLRYGNDNSKIEPRSAADLVP